MALCQFSQTFQDLSGVVDIGPRFIVGDAIVRQGILRTMGIRVAVKAGRFSNDSRSDEVSLLIADDTYVCYHDLISSSYARFMLFLNFNMRISLNYWDIPLKTPR